jgi:DNA-binding LacI/PurR family transcriptional regulator
VNLIPRAQPTISLGAVTANREATLIIPDDIALMGCSDIFAAHAVTPSPSTIKNFQHELGRAAAKMLLEILTARRSGPGARNGVRDCEASIRLIAL